MYCHRAPVHVLSWDIWYNRRALAPVEIVKKRSFPSQNDTWHQAHLTGRPTLVRANTTLHMRISLHNCTVGGREERSASSSDEHMAL